MVKCATIYKIEQHVLALFIIHENKYVILDMHFINSYIFHFIENSEISRADPSKNFKIMSMLTFSYFH